MFHDYIVIKEGSSPSESVNRERSGLQIPGGLHHRQIIDNCGSRTKPTIEGRQ